MFKSFSCADCLCDRTCVGFRKAAENEWQRKKEDSQLHVIIIDEIDALCRTRGSSGDGGAHRDSVVNQLLSKLDGLENRSNVLVIGEFGHLPFVLPNPHV